MIPTTVNFSFEMTEEDIIFFYGFFFSGSYSKDTSYSKICKAGLEQLKPVMEQILTKNDVDELNNELYIQTQRQLHNMKTKDFKRTSEKMFDFMIK